MGFNVGRSEGLNLSRIWSGFAERGGTQRIGAILLGLVVLVLGLGWGAEYLRVKRASTPLDLTLEVTGGLSSRVEILWDGRGVPHVEAREDMDAWLSLGLAHAYDRPSQMLWLRRLAEGTISEVLGESALGTDQLVRTLGLAKLAQEEWARLDERTRSVLEAYSRGVNLGLGLRDTDRGVAKELNGASGKVEKDWGPVDSLAISKLIAWETSNGIQTELVLDDLIRSLGGRWARLFRPASIAGDPSGVDSEGSPPVYRDVPDGLNRGEPSLGSSDFLKAARIFGGTAWVLAGMYTESGAPSLVADYQLPPTVPSLFYQVQLQGASLNVAGVTVPGVPVFWAGRNLDLAWAALPSGAVTADLYQETLRQSGEIYHDGQGWVDLEERVEKIGILKPGGLGEEEFRIRSTRHGPLIDGLFSDSLSLAREGLKPRGLTERPPHSLAWTGSRPGNGIASFLEVVQARDASGLVAALRSHHEPVVAVVYADNQGQGGMQWAGWLPRRTLPSRLVPVPGRMRIYDWRGPIPYEDLPIIRLGTEALGEGRSERAWVAVADGGLSAGLSRAEIEWSWQPGVRQRRLERILIEMMANEFEGSGANQIPERLDLRSAAELVVDVRDVEATEVVPAISSIANQVAPLRPEAKEILSILSRWDGELSASSQGAAAYAVLIQSIFDRLFRPVLGDVLLERYLALPGVRPQSLVARVLVAADRRMEAGGWTDRDHVTRIVHEGLRQTWVVLSQRLGPDRRDWQWGGLHGLEFEAFGPDPSGSLQLPELRVGGGDATLSSTAFGISEDFQTDRATLYRMAVDLSAPDRMLTSLAPGQSEFPESAHFGDGLEGWAKGRPGLLLMSRVLVEDETTARLILEPTR